MSGNSMIQPTLIIIINRWKTESVVSVITHIFFTLTKQFWVQRVSQQRQTFNIHHAISSWRGKCVTVQYALGHCKATTIRAFSEKAPCPDKHLESRVADLSQGLYLHVGTPNMGWLQVINIVLCGTDVTKTKATEYNKINICAILSFLYAVE